MNARLKISVILAALVAANVAVFVVKHALDGSLEPILKALG